MSCPACGRPPLRARAAFGPKDSIRDALPSDLTEPFLDAIDRLLREMNARPIGPASRARRRPHGPEDAYAGWTRRREAQLVGREGLQQERGGDRRVVAQGEAPTGPRPGDIPQSALLLQGPLRFVRLGHRPAAREAAVLHPDDHDMIEFQPLGRVGRGERQARVVATQRGQPSTRIGDRVDECLEAGKRRCPGEQRRRKLATSIPFPPDLATERRDPDQEGRVGTRAVQAVQQAVERRIVDEQRRRRRPERLAKGDGRDDGGAELAVRAGQDRPGAVVVGPGAQEPHQACRLVGRVGGQDEPPAGVGSRPDRLGEPLAVVGDEAHRALDDRYRAAVVDGQVHPPQAWQRCAKVEHPPDVGQPPAVDRLVVVADEEDPVRRRREQEGEPQLGAVDVLDLVDEQVGTGRATARAARGRVSRTTRARRTRSSKSRPPRSAIARS